MCVAASPVKKVLSLPMCPLARRSSLPGRGKRIWSWTALHGDYGLRLREVEAVLDSSCRAVYHLEFSSHNWRGRPKNQVLASMVQSGSHSHHSRAASASIDTVPAVLNRRHITCFPRLLTGMLSDCMVEMPEYPTFSFCRRSSLTSSLVPASLEELAKA